MSKRSESVKVVVRCRPLSKTEKDAGYSSVVDMDITRGTVLLRNPKAQLRDPPREFTFDCVYNWNSKQLDLYDETVRTIVNAVLEGYNGTIFAYGQTGTGKTYTMEGVRSERELRGVIPNSFDQIFTHISQSENQQYLVRASYLEIYQEEIRDLLSKDQKQHLDLKERPDTGVYVKDLSSFVAKSVKEIEHVMHIGNQNRAVGRTDMNEHSSRSHAIFIVTVESSSKGDDGEDHIRVGKLNLVDLAGSERQTKTRSTGERFKEATKINLSLSALGNVISALVDSKSTHIPYRDSKLTRLLQDSLGGNAKTIMIANVGPASYNYDETLTTLRYANRAKNIKNKPRINEDPKDALLREYQEEILRLKEALEKRKKKGKGKRRRRVNEMGEEVSEEESEGEDEKECVTDTLQEMQVKLEKDKQSILQNTEILAEERERLVSELEKKATQIKKEQKKRDQLASKIKAMESKLLSGGGIMDRQSEQKKALEKQRQAMIEQKRTEREIQQQLEAQEEERVEVQGNYQSLQEEATVKEKKLKKLEHKLQIVQAEILEYREEQTKMREELSQQLEDLEKQLKLRQLIVENFIPHTESEKIQQRAYYEEDQWMLTPIEHNSSKVPLARPISIDDTIRPLTSLAKLAAASGDVRYMAENILRLDLDMPTRTTRDYEGPLVAPTIQAVLDRAVQEEDEVTFDASLFTALNKKSHFKQTREQRSKKTTTGGQEESLNPRENYPIKRGLVSNSNKIV